MSMKLLGWAMAATYALSASAANATVYIASRTVGTGTIDFSLTTDNTVGVIGSANISSYNVSITNGGNTINFAPGNASLFVFGSALTATATDLLFDFGGAGNSFLVFNRGPGVGDHYCFETSGCSGVFNNAESFRFGQNGTFVGQPYSGVQSIASVARIGSAVPEPATWAMFLAGFGLMAATLRRRRPVALRLAV